MIGGALLAMTALGADLDPSYRGCFFQETFEERTWYRDGWAVSGLGELPRRSSRAHHDGATGVVSDGRWVYQADVPLRPGETRLGVWTRLGGRLLGLPDAGEAALAFGIDDTGGMALRVLEDQLQLVLAGAGFSPDEVEVLATVDVAVPTDDWVRLELDVLSETAIRGRLFSAGAVLLAELEVDGLDTISAGVGFMGVAAAHDSLSVCSDGARPSTRFPPLWSMLSGDPQRTGQRALDVVVPGVLPEEVWSFDVEERGHRPSAPCPLPGYGEEVLYASPAVSGDGRVFVGSQFSCPVVSPGDGWLYALDACTGEVLWDRDMRGWIESSPAISHDNQVVYIGSKSGELLALDAATGDMRWSLPTRDAVTSSPVVDAEGNVYIGGLGGYLYAAAPDGSLRWEYAMPPSSAVHTSPALSADGTVVYVSYTQSCGGPFDPGAPCPDIDFALLALDSATGDLLWSMPVAGPVWGSPMVSPYDGTLYVPDFVLPGLSRLYAVSPSGELLWWSEMPAYSNGVPSIAPDGALFVGSYASAGLDGRLSAFEADGTPRWSFLPATGNVNVQASPTLVNGGETLLFGVYGRSEPEVGGGVYAVRASDGAEEWFFETGAVVQSTVGVTPDGRAFFGDWNGVLHALGPALSPLCD